MVLAFVALVLVLAFLAGIVATEHSDAVVASFGDASRAVQGIGAGLTVALATGGHLPLLLYCGRGLRTRREASVAAVSAAICGIVPAVVFHLCFMLMYPQIIDDELPAYRLIAAVAPAIVLNVYVVVLVLADDSNGRRRAVGDARGPSHDAARSPLAALVRVGPRRDFG